VRNPARLLLIDDDAELATLMRDFFAEQNIALAVAPDGEAGLEAALAGTFDLVLLDVMMPKLDGFAVLERLRERSSVPVLMLTAVTDQPSRIAGLDGGADDYLPKPFDPVELLARIRAILRRVRPAPPESPAVFEVGGVLLDPATRIVLKFGEPVMTTAAEFDILDLLMRNHGKVVTRDEITEALYQREATPFDRWIDVHVSHLRKKLEGGGVAIRTLRGTGYQFCADVPGEA
jgi:two-component system, OmpR family, response regulator CpxR